MIKKKPKRSLAEINEQSKQLKRKRKHKGLASGSRFNNSGSTQKNHTTEVKDPRIGSKKLVQLVADTTKPSANKTVPKLNKTDNKLSLEQELKQLEDNPYLEQLLDLIDDSEALTPKQQQDLNNMLDRIDSLMNQLGLSIDDDSDQDEGSENSKEDIVSLLKQH